MPSHDRLSEAAPSALIKPYVSAESVLPEVTFKAIFLGIILAMILAGANAYLGLKMGQTISACIPAAVISMAILRRFKKSNILENNIVQTIASAGEVVASGIIFTTPALLMMGYWQEFDMVSVTILSIVGGSLGVLLSIPLRRALIIEQDLPFPEGIATAEVLKAGDRSEHKKSDAESGGAQFLVIGGISAAMIKFCQSGLQIFSETITGWFKIGGTVVGFSNSFSLAMVGAGYIVGMEVVGISMLAGTVIAYFMALPLYTFFSAGPQDFGLPVDATAEAIAHAVRSTKIRYIGVGAMMFGGIWTLFSLIQPLKKAILSSVKALKNTHDLNLVLRTDKDIPISVVFVGVAMCAVVMGALYYVLLSDSHLIISRFLFWITLGGMSVLSIVIAFVCSAIGGYMSGLVGSSSSPTSGITIGAILAISFSLLFILGTELEFGVASNITRHSAALAIMIASVMAVASAVSCDNLQDLKSGYLLGATPWKQQWTLIIGVVAGAVVMGPVLSLLHHAYGIGDNLPRLGMDPEAALSAPQAALMASVAEGIFTNTLDLPLLFIGAGIGIVVLLIDKIILQARQSSYRLSVMAVALGIYLPMNVILAIVFGAILHKCVQKNLFSRKKELGEDYEKIHQQGYTNGLLLSAGMIAGDALVGILLAVPFVMYQSTSALSIVGSGFSETASILGTMTMLFYAYYMYRVGAVSHSSRIISKNT